jgi:hypothetical protein
MIECREVTKRFEDLAEVDRDSLQGNFCDIAGRLANIWLWMVQMSGENVR